LIINLRLNVTGYVVKHMYLITAKYAVHLVSYKS